MEAYLSYGYFDLKLSRKLNKEREKILNKFNKLLDITRQFPFTAEGFQEFVLWMTPQIVKQLNYQEIITLLQ